MKFLLKHATIALAAAIACQTGTALAQNYDQYATGVQAIPLAEETNRPVIPANPCAWTEDQKTESAPKPEAAPAPVAGEMSYANCCQMCGDASGRCACCCNRMGCDECPNFGLLAFAGLDSFKGISDGSYQSNFGAVTGLNAGAPIPGLRDYGIGWQLGLSYGVYDWDGWGEEAAGPSRNTSQTQLFVTTGFFRKAREDQRLSFGLVYDWMANNNWGEYVGAYPTLGQWRGQIEYAISGCNGVGIWGTVRDRSATQTCDGFTFTNRPISQVNLFWHHKFNNCADSWLYVGVPQADRLEGVFDNGGHSLGTWTFGAAFETPLTDSLALYANGSYFRPSAAAGAIAAMESGYDVGMGIVWYPGRNAKTCAINGKCWTPFMPLANNSNFLVDQSDFY